MGEATFVSVKDRLERVWTIECRRCADEGMSWSSTADAAAAELVEQGWTDFCPACNRKP